MSNTKSSSINVSGINNTASLTLGDGGLSNSVGSIGPTGPTGPAGVVTNELLPMPAKVIQDVNAFYDEQISLAGSPHLFGYFKKDGFEPFTKISGYRKWALNLMAPGFEIKTEAVDENTLLDWWSVSKMATAAMVAIMVDRGYVSLRDPIVDYVPQLGKIGENGNMLTQEGNPYRTIVVMSQDDFESEVGRSVAEFDLNATQTGTLRNLNYQGTDYYHLSNHVIAGHKARTENDLYNVSSLPGKETFPDVFFKLVVENRVIRVIDVLRQSSGITSVNDDYHLISSETFRQRRPDLNEFDFYAPNFALDALRTEGGTNVIQKDNSSYDNVVFHSKDNGTSVMTSEDFLTYFSDTLPVLLHSPGVVQTYDPDYMCLSALVKSIHNNVSQTGAALRIETGLNGDALFGSIMMKMLFEPIGVDKARFLEGWAESIERLGREVVEDMISDNYATPHMHNADKTGNIINILYDLTSYKENNAFGIVLNSENTGGFGIVSTMGDLVKFCNFFKNKGVTESGQRLVSANMIDYFMRGNFDELNRTMPSYDNTGDIVRDNLNNAYQYNLGFYHVRELTSFMPIENCSHEKTIELNDWEALNAFSKDQVGWFGYTGLMVGIGLDFVFVGHSGVIDQWKTYAAKTLARIKRNM